MSEGSPSLLVQPPNGQQVTVPLRNKRTRTSRLRDSGNGGSRPKSEFFSPSGISTLDIRTRLRITEAELALVQREVSDLLTERNNLESSSRKHEDSWRFAVKECGRVVEQRDELQKRLDMLQQLIASGPQTPEKGKGKGRGGGRGSLEHLKLQLETQTRVAVSFEHERDKAYDDYELAQAQTSTLMKQYQELASSCSEVARERDKFKAEVGILREELHRYDPEDSLSSARNSLRKADSLVGGSHGSLASLGGGAGGAEGDDAGSLIMSDPSMLLAHVKEMKQERDKANSKYEQAMKRAEQYQKQLYRAEEDRRQALATSEALTALWQKKFEKAQNENYDLRQELLTSQERNSLLLERLAMARIQSRDVTPSRHSPPDHDTATPSPTKMFYGSYMQSASASNYSLSQALPPAPPTLVLGSSLSQSNPSVLARRSSSMTGSRDNLPPSSVHYYNPPSPHKRYHYDDTYDGSHSTDDESSWI
ncbi:uncharacterized protein LOC135331221 [Halichondria panicea]|uniref:uncharacterized protein LOC135331221 n=1 Tax=Halichondria panicea TaxID=6063 RepID=UPI00312B3790